MGERLVFDATNLTDLTKYKFSIAGQEPEHPSRRNIPGLALTMMNSSLDALQKQELSDVPEEQRVDLILAVSAVAGFVGRCENSTTAAEEVFDRILNVAIESLEVSG